MKNQTMLLVEDNPDDIALTLRALRKNNIGNTIHVARDGKEALDYLFGTGDFADQGPPPSPVLILLDLKLPKIDGLEVLQKIRSSEHTRLYPVVILTSSREQQDVLDGYNLGCNSYIRKPVDFEQFIEAVRRLGLYWLLINEPPPDIQSVLKKPFRSSPSTCRRLFPLNHSEYQKRQHRKNISQLPHPLPKVERCGSHEQIDGIADRALEIAPSHAVVMFEVADDRFDGRTTAETLPRLVTLVRSVVFLGTARDQDLGVSDLFQTSVATVTNGH